MASPADQSVTVIRQAWMPPLPATARLPFGSSASESTPAVPVKRTKLALSTCPTRLPTGRVPSGTPVGATGVPAPRLAPARGAMGSGVSVSSATTAGGAEKEPAGLGDTSEAEPEPVSAEKSEIVAVAVGTPKAGEDSEMRAGGAATAGGGVPASVPLSAGWGAKETSAP